MKKFLIIAVLLALSGGLYAQNYRSADGDNDAQRLYIAPQYYGPNEMDYFYMMPLEERLSAIYGSSYRKAASKLWAGRGLCILVAPITSVMSFGVLFDDDFMVAMGVAGLLGTAASLGAGIPLWVSGRKEMDVILDDYSRRYAPRPFNVTLGPTSSGVGFALNF